MRRCLLALLAVCATLASASAQPLKLLTLEYPPFFSTNLEGGGFMPQLVRETFHRAGYDVDIQFMPWRRALALVATGQADGLVGAYYTKERAKFMAYTDLIARNEEVFVRAKDNPFLYTGQQDLRKYSIGALDGSAPYERLKGDNFETTASTSFEHVFLKLGAKRIEVMLIGRAVMNHMLATNPKLASLQEQLEVLEPPYYTGEFFTTIIKARSDADEIVLAFNTALSEMKTDGSLKALLAKYGQNS